MKRIGENLVTLFAQYSSVEFLTTLLSCLSNENASGLSDVLKDIAQSMGDSCSDSRSPPINILNISAVPVSVLPSSGLALMKLLAQQGSVDEVLLRKYIELWNTCESYSTICEDSEVKYTYQDSLRLLLDHWAIISFYIAKHLQPGTPTNQHVESLTNFATFHCANSKSQDDKVNSTSSLPHNRYYLDVWEESEYLCKLGSSTKLRPLTDWSDLFHQYDNSNLDCSYREWLLCRLDEKKEQLLKGPRKKRKIDPIFVPYDLTLSAENREDLMRIISPPVPVSLVHPAAWSVRSFHDQSTHPASWSTSSSSSGGGKSSTANIRSSLPLDDFTIPLDRLSAELRVIELSNMVGLCRVMRFADFRRNLELLMERKRRAEDVMCFTMMSDSVRANLRAMNAVRPVMSVLSDHNSSTSNNHSSGGGCGSCYRRVKQECFCYVSPGSEQDRSSSNGGGVSESILQELHAGQEVDLQLSSGAWVVGRVLRLRKDRNFIRQAKVLPMGGGPTSSVWVSVEDELLAPVGKYTAQ